MDRCPNCGAPIRDGAKFCTTCGFRIPEPSSDSADPVSAWSAGSEPSSLVTTLDEAATTAADRTPVTADSEVDAGPASGDASGWFAAASSWPGGWNESSDAGDESAMDQSDASDMSDGVVPAPEPAADDQTMTAASDPAPPTDTSVGGQASSAADDPALAGAGAANDPLTSAQDLIDELRDLLPMVASGAGSRVAPNGAAIAAELEAARRQPDASRVREFEALRAALEHARNRPRDIDTVLDLVGRIDVVLALQDAHDRYAAAIDLAVAALRTGQTEHGDG